MTSIPAKISLPRRAAVIAIAATAVAVSLPVAAEARPPKVSFEGGALLVEGSPNRDRIFVYCNSNARVEVNGRARVRVNGRFRPLACSRVREVDVTTGGGNDLIDLSGVGRRFGDASYDGFGVGTATVTRAGSGNDRLVGSQVAFNIFGGFKGHDVAGGGRRRDLLVGGWGRDTLRGYRGNDKLHGNQMRDRLFGGKGNDRLIGGKHWDLLRPGPGRDRVTQ